MQPNAGLQCAIDLHHADCPYKARTFTYQKLLKQCSIQYLCFHSILPSLHPYIPSTNPTPPRYQTITRPHNFLKLDKISSSTLRSVTPSLAQRVHPAPSPAHRCPRTFHRPRPYPSHAPLRKLPSLIKKFIFQYGILSAESHFNRRQFGR